MPLFTRSAGRLAIAAAATALATAVGALPAGAATPATPPAPPANPVTGWDDGLFGKPDIFSSGFKQALALLAIEAVPAKQRTARDKRALAAGIAWLRRQQCADGGFEGYRGKGQQCGPIFDPFQGEDTNTTALVIQAFAGAGLGKDKATRRALGYLLRLQQPDGGFPFGAGAKTDSNSTALVVQALQSLGRRPERVRRNKHSGYDALRALVVRCSANKADRGGIGYDGSDEAHASGLAAVQAIQGLAGRPYPISAGRVVRGGPTLRCPGQDPRRLAPALDAKIVASWLATAIEEKTRPGNEDYSSVSYAVIAFTSTGTQLVERNRLVAFLARHLKAATTDAKGADAPGSLALTSLAAAAATGNGRVFAKSDLIARLEKTQSRTR